jgi:hypothetical protein
MTWFTSIYNFITNTKPPAKELGHVYNVERENFDGLRIFHIDLVRDFGYPFHCKDKTSRNDGRSGEDFMELLVLPAIKDKRYDVVIVNLTSIHGIAANWLEGAFSYLISKHGVPIETLREKLYIVPEYDECCAWNYINKAIPLQTFSKGCYR